MQCKSLWIKASAKCINVNVNVPVLLSLFPVFEHVDYVFWTLKIKLQMDLFVRAFRDRIPTPFTDPAARLSYRLVDHGHSNSSSCFEEGAESSA